MALTAFTVGDKFAKTIGLLDCFIPSRETSFVEVVQRNTSVILCITADANVKING